MECLDMYNSEHKSLCSPMSPRISFSNDFAESQQMIKQQRASSSRSEAPSGSSDFAFSVTNHSMMSGADELFFKGRLLPFKDSQMQKTSTLREELLVDDDGDRGVPSVRPPKSSTRWKGLLGLKKSHIGSKKVERRSGFVHEEANGNKTNSQEYLSEGGPSCRDVEMGI